MSDESNLAICRKCNQSVEIRYGEEHTGFCDGCAQEIVEELVAALEKMRDHKGFDENNCSMNDRELREELQEIAAKALVEAGIETEPGEES